jgi:adenine-specific DNA-methyltransferase
MPPRRRRTSRTEVEATRHQDKRANIPTTELRDFVAEDELLPTRLRYPRDPSLDPQLVWKGKDEQDGADLEVPALPIYVQEKIEPKALVEELRQRSAKKRVTQEPQLFSDFDGLSFEEKIDFYHHEANWSNRMILGDSLLVMASLAEKEGLRNKVQMIYLDPPYGIRFGSNWQVSTRKRNVQDGKDTDVTRQPEQVKAFRDTWELGIHSYLAYLRDRLVVARDLLTEAGSVFVQIGDENVHLVRCVMDEVFGSENFVSLISFATTSGFTQATALARNGDFLVWYARDLSALKYRKVYRSRSLADDIGARYRRVELPDGTRRPMLLLERTDPAILPEGARVYRHDNLTSQGSTVTGSAPYFFAGDAFYPGAGSHWKTTQDGLDRLAWANRLAAPTRNSLAYVRFLDDFPVGEYTNVWLDTQTGAFTEDKVYVVQTNTKVIERCLLMSTDPGDLVLDPTCGSGTTGCVAEQWGRRWITIDTSRVALALARTRLMAARFPYYLLTDSVEGAAREVELSGTTQPPTEQVVFGGDVRKGFVYKRVPHVTLKSIAQDPDVREGMTRKEIDRAIARHAESEALVDQPYEDPKRVRVSGRFTVESLSPHRVLDPASERPAGEQNRDVDETHDYLSMVIANLRKAGVQNTMRGERLVFDRLEAWPGEWLNAAGEYTDAGGDSRRVAISIGPEHGTVGPVQIKEAAKEALRGIGFDVLVVSGFAFDAAVGEAAREFGDLTVLPTKMNPDLSISAGLLKKTGSGNLFMVFGEPDVLVKVRNGEVAVEIRGLDIYDPTTGEVRSSSTEDIACWFIDTDYDQESFFVRHAYFIGGDDPYERLRRALRADIDEAAWQSLCSTVSRPFPVPTTGRIAVKVINHYGDEVMRVYDVSAKSASRDR